MIKVIGKIGRHDLQQWMTDSTSRRTDDFAQGQLTYFHTHHLSFNFEISLNYCFLYINLFFSPPPFS